MHSTIHLHPEAPAKPPPGEPCNGCGVCCAAEPCPVGIVLSGRRSGACDALRWDDAARRHVCGALAGASAGKPVWRALAVPVMRRLISAGSGCDCDLEVVAAA